MDSLAEETLAKREDLKAAPKIDFKKLLLMLIVGVGVALLLVRLAGEREALAVLQQARPEFVILALMAESLRYLAVALYTQKLLHFLGHHIGLWSFVELMFAGGAANRIVSAGGTAGIYVRYRFFERHGLSLGSLIIVLTLQNLMTGLILLTTFFLGVFYLLTHRLIGATQMLVAASMLLLMSGLVLLCVLLYGHPRRLKRFVAGLSRLVDVPVRKFTKRSIYNTKELARSIDNLYRAIDVARAKPLETGKALGYGIITLFADVLSLFFVFHALGFAIRLDVLVVGYIITNYVVSLLLMPEGIGITELSLSAAYTGLGVPAGTVVVATLLFRFIAFWLPIGVGLLAMWDLRRKSQM